MAVVCAVQSEYQYSLYCLCYDVTDTEFRVNTFCMHTGNVDYDRLSVRGTRSKGQQLTIITTWSVSEAAPTSVILLIVAAEAAAVTPVGLTPVWETTPVVTKATAATTSV